MAGLRRSNTAKNAEGMNRATALRVRLFTMQRGYCIWCGCKMTWPHKPLVGKALRLDMATLEHLDSRLSGARGEFGGTGERRVWLACKHCNEARGLADEYRAGIVRRR